MPYLRGINRDQVMLLPPSVDEYVSAENHVRVMDAFIEGLDLGNLGFELRREQAVGAPGYDPKGLLKLYLYGYLNRIRSSRELEKATRRNLEVIWLTRHLQPDHWTINEFRRKHRSQFKKVFREFGLLCRSLGLFGAELVAIDGTFLKAVNSPQRNLTVSKAKEILQKIDEKTERYLAELDAADKGADGQGSNSCEKDPAALREKLARLEEEQKRCRELMKALEQSETKQVSLTDSDSRMLKKGNQSVVGYNAQVAVDAKYHLIAVDDVTQDPSDWKQFTPMAVKAKEALEVEKLSAVADTGYCSREQVSQCVEQGIEPNIPKKAERKAGTGEHPLSVFQHDATRDCYTCPQGKDLRRKKDDVRPYMVYRVYSNSAACKGCPLLEKCTKGSYRKLTIPVESEHMLAMEKRLREQPHLMRQRSQIVEHVFGTIKFWWGFRSFLCRGLKAVQAEFSLTALAYNFRRALTILGTERLVAAIRAQAGA